MGQLCSLYGILHNFLYIYTFVLFAYALVSWFPSLRRYRVTEVVAMLVEPVISPLRRIIPPFGGLDLSFLVLILLIQLVDRSIVVPNMIQCAY
ncbi:MAG: YggT family protein [Candidatus Velthaea sp.]